MNKYKYFLCISILLFVSACASTPKGSDETVRIDDDEPFMEKSSVSSEADVRKPIFIYDCVSSESLSEVTLRINSEPLLLTAGYVRLVGVVSGRRPIALIEVGGKGLSVEGGDIVGGYRITRISNKFIVMTKEGAII
jgi:hypothetical protein